MTISFPAYDMNLFFAEVAWSSISVQQTFVFCSNSFKNLGIVFQKGNTTTTTSHALCGWAHCCVGHLVHAKKIEKNAGTLILMVTKLNKDVQSSQLINL